MAMMNWLKKTPPTEDQLVQLIDEFAKRLETKSFDGMWIPDVHGLDGEKDDRLALGLIQYVRFGMKLPPVKTIWQLPPQFEDFATSFAWLGHLVFVDAQSSNAQALVKQLL
jgi:alkanesulfonate monooxygenase SsuD/methylene tetrahydromethanopterin reductase-like flavin-dependent oxidoreductase (luciferase family)